MDESPKTSRWQKTGCRLVSLQAASYAAARAKKGCNDAPRSQPTTAIIQADRSSDRLRLAEN